MKNYTVKILNIANVTHDVLRFEVEKPAHYIFTPGQATEVSINMSGWENELRPFTFTSLNDSPYLEFIFKSYSEHRGVTNKMKTLKVGDSLNIRDPWGAIEYKGPGYFIAGGAGITPFIAILRLLQQERRSDGNRLFFSNKTSCDIILENELVQMLGKDNVIFTLTGESSTAYDSRYIDEDFLKTEIGDFKKPFYICGPEQMVNEIFRVLIKLGASPDKVVFEK